MRSVAVRLKEARKLSGFTQKQAAERLGISQSSMSMIENGRRSCSAEMAERFFALYKEAAPPSEVIARHRREQSAGLEAARLLLDMAAASGSVVGKAADNYIAMCAYLLIRRLYKLNPHNSDSIFRISDEMAEHIERMIADEPMRISVFAMTDEETDLSALEPSPEDAELLRSCISCCEQLIFGDNTEQ